jgi:hypothetical protein
VPAMVGVGMAATTGLFISEAMRMNRKLKTSVAIARLSIHVARTAMLLLCCALTFVPLVYLLVETDISISQAGAILVGITAGYAALARERLLRPKEWE